MTRSARLSVKVEWGDCDPAGIVFYPNYLRWFDAATHHLFDSVGADWKELFHKYNSIGVPLVGVDCKFIKPSRHGDRIEVEASIVEWRNRTFRVQHRVFNDGELAVEGSETRFWGIGDADDPERLRAGVIPAEVKALFDDGGPAAAPEP